MHPWISSLIRPERHMDAGGRSPDFESLEPRLLLSQTAFPLDAIGFVGDTPLVEAAAAGAEVDAGGAGAGTLIAGVPAYYWYRGCGPTAAGMVIGYWDTQGYDDLVVGDASTQTPDVDNMIASPEHYTDYALPIDTTATGLLADKSETGGAHANNSVADWMRTSWSSVNNYYGWSWFSNMDDGLDGYAQSQGYAGANAWNESWGAFTWNDLVAEVDAGRPMLLLVDSDGNAYTDHIVTAIGYDATTNQYAAHNTWDYSVHWYNFGPLTPGQAWGIYGATFFDPGALPSTDETAPSAELSVTDVTGSESSTHTFTVTFSDDVAIDVSDITRTNVRVTGPNGFGQYADLAGVDDRTDGTPRTATLFVTAPNGAWDLADNGTYTVSIRASQVSDTSGNFVPAGALGTFDVALAAPAEVIVDNDSPAVTVTGAWSTSSFNDTRYGASYLHDGNAAKGSKSVTYAPLLGAGTYDVYVWHPYRSTHATNVPVDIAHSTGTDTVTVDQTAPGGTWLLLGTYNFNAGASGNVTVRTDATNGYVIADAVRFTPSSAEPVEVIVDNTSPDVTVTGSWSTSSWNDTRYGTDYLHDDNTDKGAKSVTYAPTLNAGTYDVYIWHPYRSTHATNVSVDITYAGGLTSTATVDQTAPGGTWLLLGTYAFDAGSAGTVTIRTDGTDGYVIADAVKFTSV